MHIGMIVEMAAENLADRIAIGPRGVGTTFAELGRRARRAGTVLRDGFGGRVVLVDENSPAVPLGLYGAAIAGKPFAPVNYRLADDRLRAIIERTAPATVIAGPGTSARLAGVPGIDVVPREEFLRLTDDTSIDETDGWGCDPDDTAVLLFTSGTSGEPKAAVLRHRNLAAYVVGSSEFGSAAPDEAALVTVPPYHVASVSSALSTTFIGRRTVYLERFDPEDWVLQARANECTHAMVVPTMLGRILDVIEADGEGPPDLRSLAYGGGPMPGPVVERAMQLLPHVDLVNAYGLTETSSTIALLDAADHREAFASDDPAVRRRLGSVGRPLPAVEVTVRGRSGEPVPVNEVGEIWVRGEQVSGEYEGADGSLRDGWFDTRDAGYLDESGFLYVEGRLDDIIVRGGENISPGEIERVLLEHPAVDSAAVVGVPDLEWGERIAAAVVVHEGVSASEAELQDFVRARLRSTRTPQHIQFRSSLPFNETGKLLRRVLRDELAGDV